MKQIKEILYERSTSLYGVKSLSRITLCWNKCKRIIVKIMFENTLWSKLISNIEIMFEHTLLVYT